MIRIIRMHSDIGVALCMPISRKEVQHISKLARIELSEPEEQKFEHELSAILEFVGKLNEADTTNVEPMAGGTTLENVMRSDEQVDKNLEGKAAELIDAAPEKKERWVKVEAIFS